ncbi:adenylyl-sulfate kinase [Portibacter lacus]|uniref:Adenylyl-sulfate kinase n=1 Tax=Portibacter lacus TaxID=1099794 RepID=A0AA37WFF3_9BACT|nr:adenylyl-sulfate kinase [Portibacter lacus]GLR18823.1 adenylyl-sulfate kinase [Portibacter lacus]
MENIHPIFDRIVSRKEKEQFLNQKSGVFWLTGLSGSGKSTIAEKVERMLFNKGHLVQIVDGDNIRSGVCNNLGFSLEDREENIRRIAEVSKLMMNCGIICINSFVSPTEKIREKARGIIGPDDFHEIFISTTLEECENRDVKGLYAKARAGEIKNFTGIDSPYEIPRNPALVVETATKSVEESAQMLFEFIVEEIEKK